MGLSFRWLPEFLFLILAIWCQWRLGGWSLELPFVSRSVWRAKTVRIARSLGTAWLGMSFLYVVPVLDDYLSRLGWLEWLKGFSLAWGICVVALWALLFGFRKARLWRQPVRFDPARRRLLRTSGAMLLAAPVAFTGYGIAVERNRFRLTEVDVPLAGLPPDLNGLRIVQLSDIHLGPFLERKELRRVVEMANETRAHLAVVTGDLITLRDDFLADCLEELSRLRAEAPILGCLGNHEEVARCQQRAKSEGARAGIDFLRGERRRLRFGSAALNVAGVDYQQKRRQYLTAAGEMVRPGDVNVLLSHNPDVFPVAARQGYDLTLAGHTHGGQVTVEILHQYLNVARFFTPYVYGLYRQERSAIFVTRGIGTVAVPARIGAPPEIALIRLCAT
jgi:predicted MPP superfamily phosphohydrolase